ncbi:glucose 1-dehydrogenase [Oceanobacillus kimchii]|uniref:glucose 1-dehydrogenase n=1 Tax=Oceanobacillus kimchii TaxID=746691 RepID=UPI000348EC0C|nr:glucose 1-dehydrogenase [Oceanobacillus kimchii]MCT1578334.1 glucose 1-dehydrogenase [Oceanobacillus kimchii]MCT2134512.1 glucose 1-dehydrogenase [Oceanobacillus kimchii]
MNELFDLTGKVAVITGGNRGIGKSIASGLASAGANIVIIARNVGEDVLHEIRKEGVDVIGINFDLSNFQEYETVVQKVIAEFGKADILVNNAGVQIRHPSVEFPKNDWDAVIDINTNAVFFLCQAFGKHMLERKSGKIINLASMLSYEGGYLVPAYAASKGAVKQFTQSLSNEWAEFGINVNCIAPGYFETDMNTAIIEDEKRYNSILERIPAGRWGKPDDLKGIAIFLASRASDYMNGFTVAVDGGYLGR